MFKIYIKQTFALLRQNVLISSISIMGTALALMMIMVVIIIQHINEVPMAPEVNRDRTLYIHRHYINSKDTLNNSIQSGELPYSYYDEYFKEMSVPKKIGVYQVHTQKAMVNLPGLKDYTPLTRSFTNDAYWEIMEFDFIEGNPYDKADYLAGIKKVVLTEKTAKELFGTTTAIDKQIEIDFEPYMVCGVVKNVSPIFTYCQGDFFIPVTSVDVYKNTYPVLILLAESKNDFAAVKEEVRNIEIKFNASDPENNIKFPGPHSQRVQQEGKSADKEMDESNYNKRTFFILALLFLIPAVNLSSFSMSQIKKRIEEIGIRKAFGAKKRTIITQVLFENLVTSLIGGIVGLILSFGVIHWLRTWLLEIPADGAIPTSAYISPFIFLAVFCSCVLLNLISAGIPALRTLRMNIVDSLNRK